MTRQEQSYRHNHYVPEWYQKRFLRRGTHKYWYLDLKPGVRHSNGAEWVVDQPMHRAPARCFAQNDLYTTQWGSIENTEIEQFFFGEIDNTAKPALEFFAGYRPFTAHDTAFQILMTYMSLQKLRTPKGLGFLEQLTRLKHRTLTLVALQHLKNVHCAIWTECVWQIASASTSPTKLIISDHPVTVYNRECFPDSRWCRGFNDPDIRLAATHTYFPLDLDTVLILTNLSWVRDPYQSAIKLRPNPNPFRSAVFSYQDIQVNRTLDEGEVLQINYVTKKRAHRFIAAAEKAWLYPERRLKSTHWRKLGDGYLFMPDPRHVFMGGQVYFGYKDGSSEGFGEYGHRPGEQGFEDKSREERERKSLHKFKAEWAAMFGPEYRGVTAHFGHPDAPLRTGDDPEFHAQDVKEDRLHSRRPGERRRRRSLRQKF